MIDEAVYELYNTARSIKWADDGTYTVYDIDGNTVTVDASAVQTKATELLAASNLEDLRVERNKRLAETDWWDLSDTPTMTSAQTTYRQALRDITDTYSSMDDDGFAWPEKPA